MNMAYTNIVRLGDRFFKIDDEENLTQLRVIKMKNENSFICINMDTKEKRTMTKELINNEEYLKLEPDGLIAFCSVDLQQGSDIIVMNYLMDDLMMKNGLPFSVCRQNVYDLFTNNLPKVSEQDIYVGMSVNRNNIPDNTPFELMLACEKIKKNVSIDVYIDDTLEDMLALFDNTPFDQVLISNFNHILPCTKGYHKSLKELLVENNFMYDFYKGHNIWQVPFEMDISKNRELMPRQRSYIENLTGIPMINNCIVRYTKEFNSKKFPKMKYILVGDKLEHVYILAYDSGEYLNNEQFNSAINMRDSMGALKYFVNNK